MVFIYTTDYTAFGITAVHHCKTAELQNCRTEIRRKRF
jgi:hypothetical protein